MRILHNPCMAQMLHPSGDKLQFFMLTHAHYWTGLLQELEGGAHKGHSGIGAAVPHAQARPERRAGCRERADVPQRRAQSRQRCAPGPHRHPLPTGKLPRAGEPGSTPPLHRIAPLSLLTLMQADSHSAAIKRVDIELAEEE